MTINIICALTDNRAIGMHGKLIYHLPADLKHFKELTTGHTIIMGRKTFESLPKGALPNRRNVVITRQINFTAPNIEVFHSLDEAFSSCKKDEDVFIIGGESIYVAALPLAHRLCLTHIHATPNEADTFFPCFNFSDWEIESEEYHEANEKNPQAFTFTIYRREKA